MRADEDELSEAPRSSFHVRSFTQGTFVPVGSKYAEVAVLVARHGSSIVFVVRRQAHARGALDAVARHLAAELVPDEAEPFERQGEA